ncbi:hypothetical protein [Schaalia hyovaginalis]|uniref:hypothetical protein n=1 Tax=Schaalia hyovaginalis TaxID=29316 RepID=UPI0016225604|nr:hypothetical protein [Schaalia hyovaginalis]MDY2669768.1 hypothetical protein [Schaalia hyovaginalis]
MRGDRAGDFHAAEPGIPSLLTLLHRRWEAIEADLLRVYGVDLLDLFRGRLTLRRLAVLVKGLPPGSQTGLLEGGPAALSNEASLIRDVGWRIECTILGAMGAKQSQMPPRPEPPEPGWQERAAEKQRKAEAKARAWLARHPEIEN